VPTKGSTGLAAGFVVAGTDPRISRTQARRLPERNLPVAQFIAVYILLRKAPPRKVTQSRAIRSPSPPLSYLDGGRKPFDGNVVDRTGRRRYLRCSPLDPVDAGSAYCLAKRIAPVCDLKGQTLF